MAYGFVSKNDDDEYLITDQTTNLTFVKESSAPTIVEVLHLNQDLEALLYLTIR